MARIDSSMPRTRYWDHDRVSIALLLGLLFARLAVGIALMPVFSYPFYRAIVATLYEVSTAWLTALLLYWERDRLVEFRIGRLAVILFIAAAPYQLVLGFTNLVDLQIVTPLLNLTAAVWLAVMITWANSRGLSSGAGQPVRFARFSLPWLGIGCLVGVAAGLFSGWLLSYQPTSGLTHRPLLHLMLLPTIQLVNAAVEEEPLFRGFLWGWLEKKGWRGIWIWLFQAALFWFGHLYYLGVMTWSFWVVTPLMGLLLGWLSWRARSIEPGMFAHALTNGIAQIISGN